MISPQEFLAHHGVKGMKWGVRKKNDSGQAPIVKKQPELVLEKKFKTGDTISIYKNPPSRFMQFMARRSEGHKDLLDNAATFTLKDKDGKKVGQASFYRRSKEELYLDWIGIKGNHRGKGYASAALDGVVKYAEKEGIQKLTLDVPGNAPDAKHIYSKLGFKSTGKLVKDGDDDPWGGLEPMELKVKSKTSVKHADEPDPEQWAVDFSDDFAAAIEEFFANNNSVEQSSMTEDFLAHFGVKGMKWGRRKKQGPTSADAKQKAGVKSKAKEQGLQSVSNKDLQAAINRMNLEQQFKRLAVNEQPAVKRFISSTLLEIGKREATGYAQRKVASTIAKKVAVKAVTGGLG